MVGLMVGLMVETLAQSDCGRTYHRIQIQGDLKNCTVGKCFPALLHICHRIRSQLVVEHRNSDKSYPLLLWIWLLHV